MAGGNTAVAPTLAVAAPAVQNTGTVYFAANQTVDAGSTNTYVVVIEGIVVDSTAYTQGWTVSLSDLNFSSAGNAVNVSSYQNLGSLPITDTK